jgi:hypothetical protein
MPRISPTAEGFRVAFRRPSVTLAEIAWRWTAGATACALLLFGFLEYLDTLPVTDSELLFLRTRHPILVAQAVTHILRGSVNRAMIAGLLAALALTALWIIAASLGRAATTRALLDYFRMRRDVAGNDFAEAAATAGKQDAASDASGRITPHHPLHALFRLNFLRAAVVLAAIFGLAGAAILTSFVSSDADPQPGLAFLLFLPLAALVCLAAWTLNWMLSLATVFAVRDGADALGSLSSSVSLCRDRSRAIAAVTSWSSLAHMVAFVGATTAVSLPLTLIAAVPVRLVNAGLMLLTLAYFAVVDWLYTARLAGYVCIAETPEALLLPAPPSAPVPVPPPAQNTIDRDEPILSDVQNLAMET